MDAELPTPPRFEREPFRAHLLQALVLVLTGMSVLFGLLAASWLLGLFLLMGHALISAFLANAIWQGDRRRRDFALVCVTPNLAGYLFALGGLLGWERWLLISLAIFTTLAVVGIARRLPAGRMLSQDRWIGWLPIVGRWVAAPEESAAQPKSGLPVPRHSASPDSSDPPAG